MLASRWRSKDTSALVVAMFPRAVGVFSRLPIATLMAQAEPTIRDHGQNVRDGDELGNQTSFESSRGFPGHRVPCSDDGNKHSLGRRKPMT